MSNDLNFEHIWQWADNVYVDNQALCLSLQDQHGVNVNLLLLCAYLDTQTQQKYDSTHWQRLFNNVQHWESKLLTPYRKLRRLAKSMLERDEYQKMLDLELMMERKCQRLIQTEFMQHDIDHQGSKQQSAVHQHDNYQSNINSYLAIFDLADQHIELIV